LKDRYLYFSSRYTLINVHCGCEYKLQENCLDKTTLCIIGTKDTSLCPRWHTEKYVTLELLELLRYQHKSNSVNPSGWWRLRLKTIPYMKKQRSKNAT